MAQILEAAAAVIAEKGYDATTMAEVAARAGAQIGSLYRFFPNKDVLANAFIERFHKHAGEVFDGIDQQAKSLSIAELTDALLDVLGDLRVETRTIVALLEGTAELSARRIEFRNQLRKRIAQTLVNYCPDVRKAQAENVAAVVLQSMKSMGALTKEIGSGVKAGALVELRVMTRNYLAKTFADAGCRE